MAPASMRPMVCCTKAMVSPSDFAVAWMSGELTIASNPAAVLVRLATSSSTGRAAILFRIAVADACSASIVAGTDGMTGTGPLVSSSAGGAFGSEGKVDEQLAGQQIAGLQLRAQAALHQLGHPAVIVAGQLLLGETARHEALRLDLDAAPECGSRRWRDRTRERRWSPAPR